ncbi:GAF domain-containing protein [Streptomyces echinoruber]|uniref:Histidine kinase n=1 Tax=Streptomyces echinoruber TaxID=68898 RepID=A0A918QVQ7_9ACTN|nr:GAF domain-containing protein [Streptomyces echinoruber]GGZ73467.1 histidine kinase [Streptomyces echinoruber]
MTHQPSPPRLPRRTAAPGLRLAPARPVAPGPRLAPARPVADAITPPASLLTPGTGTASTETARDLAELAARRELIDRLGIPTGPDAVFDTIATQMATAAGFTHAMVNVFLDEQIFVGLHNPPQGSGHPIVGRTMDLGHGYCPEVVRRKKALPLHNVHAAPRFSGNPVVDAIGIQSYYGAPLIHAESGLTLGTVCIVDPEPRRLEDSRRLLDIVAGGRNTVLRVITGRTPAA